MKTNIKPEECALVIIDIQDKLANVMEERDVVVKNTNILIETARTFNMGIVVTEQYTKGLGMTTTDLKLDREKDFFEEKMSFTGYTENVAKKLKELGRKIIILTGIETHVCVFQTARDLLDNGYRVIVSRDAVCSRTKENKQNGLDLMHEEGAFISNTETILFDLLKVSGTPEFKALSKLIK